MTGPRNPVGTHVRVGPGLVKGTLKGARELGLERSHLYKKMRALGIQPRGKEAVAAADSDDDADAE